MKKMPTRQKLTFIVRIKILIWCSMSLAIGLPVLLSLITFRILLLFIFGGIREVMKIEYAGDLKRVRVLLSLWLCAIKLIFKKNRRNIATMICIAKKIKSKKL